MNTKKYDLTQGSILSRLLLVAVPLMGTQLLQMAYNLTDMFWLGRVGSDAVASVGTAGMYMWLSVAFLVIGRMGAEIGVSQYIGRSDPETAKSFAQNALFLAAIFGTLFAFFIHFLRVPLIGIFAIQEAHVAADAATYLGIVAIGMPAAFISGAVTGTFNGVGASRIPFITNGIGIVLNMALTPLMIFTLDLGLHGAAWATVIAQTVVLVLSLLAVRKLSVRPFHDLRLFTKPEAQRIRQMFRWTVPIAVESGAFTILSMFIGRFVAAWGADALAVQRVGIQVESFSWMIGIGFSSAVTAFVGQNYGAGRWRRIRGGTSWAFRIMLIWGVVTTAIPWIFGRQMFALFISDEIILAEGVRFLRILSVCQLLVCLEFWAIGVFRGLGKTTPPSVATIIGNTLRIPLAYFLSLTSLGVAGLRWGITLGACMRAVILVVWYMIYARRLPREDIAPSCAGEENLLS